LLTINMFSQIHNYPLPNEIKRIEKNDFFENYINYEKNVQYSAEDSTIIDPLLLDTSNYSGKYILMGVYDLFNPGFDGKLTLGDFNGDKILRYIVHSTFLIYTLHLQKYLNSIQK